MQNCYNVILSFREALSILKDTSDISLNRFMGGKFSAANKLHLSIQTILTNAYSFNFSNQTDAGLSGLPFVEWDTDNSIWKFKPLFNDFVDFLFQEFGDSFCVRVPSETDSDYIVYSTAFMDNFLNLILCTYDRYQVLANAYNVERNQLLRGVKATYTGNDYTLSQGSNSNSGFSKQKDTPQNAVTIQSLGDNYNTSVSVNSGEGSTNQTIDSNNSRTAIEERETPIQRLKEIDEKYKDLLRDWSNEFVPLFWEV